jgi:hypothetical protein
MSADAESCVLGAIKELGYASVFEDMFRQEHTNPGLLAIDIAERHELRLETEKYQGRTIYKFTPIEA